MALPIVNSYRKTVKSPVTEKTYEIRPYLVGEEKALMISAESENPNEIRDAIFNMISACTTGGITKDITSFDLEYLFMEIRKLSADQIVELNMVHKDCGGQTPLKIDLNEITVSDIPNKVVILDENRKIGIKMKMPSMQDLLNIETDSASNIVKGFMLMAKSIECVFEGEEVYTDFTEEELLSWLDNLNDKQMEKISAYINNLPSLKMDLEYTCSGCSKHVKQEVRGIQNFLA